MKLLGALNMKNLRISQQNKMLLLSFSFLIISYIVFAPSHKESEISKKDPIYADTLIPHGFVLIPIELANAESVASLMDQFGVVDLYSGSASSKGNIKVISRVKILRAPLNPNQYAILVPDQLSNKIMSAVGPFWAVVLNHETKQNLQSDKKIQPVRIEYHKEGA